MVCRSCGSRFHAKPGATTWTCPRCGLLQDASAEPPPPAPAEPVRTPVPMTITDADLDAPQEPPGSAFPPGLGLGDDAEGPQDAFAMPVRESGGRRLWPFVLGAIVAVVLLVLLFNIFLGGGDGGEPSGGDGGGQAGGALATTAMCGHIQQVQVVRDDALGAAAEQLREDVAALKEAGERRTAKQVRAVIAAIGDVREAVATQQPTEESFAALQDAMAALPC